MTYGSRLITTISDEALLSIVKGLFGSSAKISAREILTGGKFNTTYRVRTACHEGEIVIRLAPIRQDLLYRFERSLQRAEVDIYRLLESRGIPVPKVLLHDDSHGILDREYIVTGFIESVPLNEIKLAGAAQRKVMGSLGAYCRRIHSISGEGFGWFGMRHEPGLAKTWHGFLSDYFEEIAGRSERFGVTPLKHVQKLRNLILRGPTLFPNPVPAVLLHNDLHPGNVLMRKAGRKYGIAALIDADRALFGDPEFELGTSDLAGPEFLEGYGRPLDASPEAGFRRKIYGILRNMVDADACLVQLGNPRVHGILSRCIEADCDSL